MGLGYVRVSPAPPPPAGRPPNPGPPPGEAAGGWRGRRTACALSTCHCTAPARPLALPCFCSRSHTLACLTLFSCSPSVTPSRLAFSTLLAFSLLRNCAPELASASFEVLLLFSWILLSSYCLVESGVCDGTSYGSGV